MGMVLAIYTVGCYSVVNFLIILEHCRSSLTSFRTTFWVQMESILRFVLDAVWNHFDTTLGIILMPLWDPFWDLFWDHFGTILGPILGSILTPFWGRF